MRSLSNIFHLLLPPIFFKIAKKIQSNKPKVHLALPQRDIVSKKVVIIGNGPSLNDSIRLYGDTIGNYDRIAVNYFASSALFDVIRPNIYVLVDPMWFSETEFQESAKALVKKLSEETTWPMTIVMPIRAKGSTTQSVLESNKNISLQFYYESYYKPNGVSDYEAWDKNLISPPGQTVLNTCVWLSIYWGYKETYLIGADTSFLADELIDQETNEVYTIDRHFYSNDEVYKDKDLFKENRRIIHSKFHEELISVATALKGYWDMREYADWKGVKVYNASEYSWIDAFERKKLC